MVDRLRSQPDRRGSRTEAPIRSLGKFLSLHPNANYCRRQHEGNERSEPVRTWLGDQALTVLAQSLSRQIFQVHHRHLSLGTEHMGIAEAVPVGCPVCAELLFYQ